MARRPIPSNGKRKRRDIAVRSRKPFREWDEIPCEWEKYMKMNDEAKQIEKLWNEAKSKDLEQWKSAQPSQPRNLSFALTLGRAQIHPAYSAGRCQLHRAAPLAGPSNRAEVS